MMKRLPRRRNRRWHNASRCRERGKRGERRAQDCHIYHRISFTYYDYLATALRSHAHSIEKISYKFPTRFLQNSYKIVGKAKIGNAADQVIAPIPLDNPVLSLAGVISKPRYRITSTLSQGSISPGPKIAASTFVNAAVC